MKAQDENHPALQEKYNSKKISIEEALESGRKKSLHKGKIIGGFALGTQKLYELLSYYIK